MTSRGPVTMKCVYGEGRIETPHGFNDGIALMMFIKEKTHDRITFSLNMEDVSIMCTLNSDHLLLFDQILKGEFCE